MEAWKHWDFVWSCFFLGGWNDGSEHSSKIYIYIYVYMYIHIPNGREWFQFSHFFWNSPNDLMLSQHLGPSKAPSSSSEKREPSHKYLGRLEVPAQRGRSQLPEGGVSSHGSLGVLLKVTWRYWDSTGFFDHSISRWWQLKHCLFSPRKLGKMNPFWRSYFSDGLVQPPTKFLFGGILFYLFFSPASKATSNIARTWFWTVVWKKSSCRYWNMFKFQFWDSLAPFWGVQHSMFDLFWNGSMKLYI